MKENDSSSSKTANTRSAEKVIFNIMIHQAGKKNEKETINKEYESIKDNIEGIVKFIQSPLDCTRLCSDKYIYKSRSGDKSIIKEVGSAYRNIDVDPSHTTTWWGKILHKIKQAVNYAAPFALTTLGGLVTVAGGLATAMTGGAFSPVVLTGAGMCITGGSLLFGHGTTKHDGISDNNYYSNVVNGIINDEQESMAQRDINTLKKNAVDLTKALVKLQGGLVRLTDETVDKYCQKLKDLVECIQKKEALQDKSNNIDDNMKCPQQDLYDNQIKINNNQPLSKNNLNTDKIMEQNIKGN